MTTSSSRIVLSLLIASVICFLAMDFAEARRGAGGGGRSMTRGGPAASGSFQRSRARPQRSMSRTGTSRSGTREGRAGQRPDRSGQRQDRSDQRQDRSDERQDRFDERQQNRQDRFDQRQDNIDERQDFRKEVYDDRKEYYDDRNEWYEDRWRAGAYITVASWNRMNCAYTTVLIDGITYYDCAGVRYERVYHGGQVTYIIVN